MDIVSTSKNISVLQNYLFSNNSNKLIQINIIFGLALTMDQNFNLTHWNQLFLEKNLLLFWDVNCYEKGILKAANRVRLTVEMEMPPKPSIQRKQIQQQPERADWRSWLETSHFIFLSLPSKSTKFPQTSTGSVVVKVYHNGWSILCLAAFKFILQASPRVLTYNLH